MGHLSCCWFPKKDGCNVVEGAKCLVTVVRCNRSPSSDPGEYLRPFHLNNMSDVKEQQQRDFMDRSIWTLLWESPLRSNDLWKAKNPYLIPLEGWHGYEGTLFHLTTGINRLTQTNHFWCSCSVRSSSSSSSFCLVQPSKQNMFLKSLEEDTRDITFIRLLISPKNGYRSMQVVGYDHHLWSQRNTCIHHQEMFFSIWALLWQTSLRFPHSNHWHNSSEVHLKGITKACHRTCSSFLPSLLSINLHLGEYIPAWTMYSFMLQTHMKESSENSRDVLIIN